MPNSNQEDDGDGIVHKALTSTALISVLLIAVIVLCAVLLGVSDLSAPWRVTLQTATAVAGAALGNVLRIDYEKNAVRNQARPAVRHLFDQVDRLREMVNKAELYQAALQEPHSDQQNVSRMADWFGGLGSGLRNEINATATAIENWSDLAPDVRVAELDNYINRADRLPPHPREETNRTEDD